MVLFFGLPGGIGPIIHIPTPTPPTPTLSPTVSFTPKPSPSPTYPVIMNCFPEVPENRTGIMEVGTRDFELIGPLESKDEPIVIEFTEYNQPIGSIKFLFFPNNQIFKIEKVVDSTCQEIEEYSNIVRGGDKNVYQNFDSVQMQFGDYKYLLRFGYHSGRIVANLVRTV